VTRQTSIPTRDQIKQVKQINAFLTGVTLTSIISLITAALQIAGVINVEISRLLIFLAWAIGVTSIFLLQPQKRITILKIIAVMIFSLVFLLFDRWVVQKANELRKASLSVDYLEILVPRIHKESTIAPREQFSVDIHARTYP